MMNRKIFLIAGTRDGRELAEILIGQNFDVTASVVSDYGRKLLGDGIKVNDKSLDADGLEKILREENFSAVVDASHPYAKNVSTNAIHAAQTAKIFYVRYERAQVEVVGENIFPVDSYEAAAVKASELGKNIFLTTGSRSLKVFVESPALRDCNLTARILPTAEVLAQCEALGLSPKQIVAVQGPFSVALNVELFKHAAAQVVVTKNSGQIGGADTKLEAAKILNLPVVMIDRPKIFYPNLATTFDGVLKLLAENFSARHVDSACS